MFTDIIQDRSFLNFRKFQKKRPCWNLLIIKLQVSRPKKRLQHRCFPVKSAKYFSNTLIQLLLQAPQINKHSHSTKKHIPSVNIAFFANFRYTFQRCSIKLCKIQRKSPAIEFFLVKRTESIMSVFLWIFRNFSKYLFHTKLIIDCLCK